ncbi:MFS transporter [Motiliproteus sediminis]|uniref:MFS transporter n=1 Tax=Motiliproteus sediminis TaxID=1468178 RepID=UPI001FE48580|nr:MFS transporter [Motiliproteus sediminis]
MMPPDAMPKTPERFLTLMAVAATIAFATWQTLLNNFAIEHAAFTGAEIGILQSLREVPGFLAFTAVFLLLILLEQTLALLALATLAVGVAITGMLPTTYGLYATTVLMSIGFHYYETLQSSLTLQWLPKQHTAVFMGRVIAAKAAASLSTFATIWLLFELFEVAYHWIYLLAGSISCTLVFYLWRAFPRFTQPAVQHRKLLLRRRYWLYYALTFMSGARRQIFIVFAGFLMVEKFHYSVAAISLLFLANQALNLLLAPRLGRLVQRLGERRALMLEYSGLIAVFSGYALANSAETAAVLYVIDNLFFVMAIAMKTYFQKIADPQDIAATAGVSFTINHIAAVVIPVLFGLIWLQSPATVFLCGAFMAAISLLLSFNIPLRPAPGNEALVGRFEAPPASST